jgi:hypothetical protein
MRTMNVALLAIPLQGPCCCPAHDKPLHHPPPLRNPRCLATAPMPNDRVDNVHQVRFIEIFLVGREASTGNIVAAVYNTMNTAKGIPASKDTSPQALLEGLDFDHIKKQYGVLGASLNGPKLCLPDWVEIDVGVERDFNGLAAAWVAQLNMGNNTSVGDMRPTRP